MPELPEVETVKIGITEHLLGSIISEVRAERVMLRKPMPVENLITLVGSKVISISRRAKYIFINFDSSLSLIIHLGMSGALLLDKSATYLPKKHDHLVINFDNSICLIYNDPRRFGLVDLCKTDECSGLSYLAALGPEPFAKNFNFAYFQDMLKKRSLPIKLALMDNKILVGVGNIYANEILYEAGISPLRSANSLKAEEIEKLILNIQAVLSKAIKAGGSTLKDYKKADGTFGGFQEGFHVYGRKGLSCFRCSSQVTHISQSRRSTYFCSTCQT